MLSKQNSTSTADELDMSPKTSPLQKIALQFVAIINVIPMIAVGRLFEQAIIQASEESKKAFLDSDFYLMYRCYDGMMCFVLLWLLAKSTREVFGIIMPSAPN